VNPAATCVSKTFVTSVDQVRRSSAMSWRAAWSTTSTSGSARTSASGAGRARGSRASSTSTQTVPSGWSTAIWTTQSSARYRPSPMNSVSIPSRPVARARSAKA
jgi:hypothetical protein